MILESVPRHQWNAEPVRLRIYRYYAMQYPFYEMSPHTHPEWEIMYVVNGKSRVCCRTDDGEQRYELREGDYILIAGGMEHTLRVEKETPCRVLNLEGRLEEGEPQSHLEWLRKDSRVDALLNGREKIFVGNDDGRLHDILKALIRELREEAQDAMTDILLGQFVLEIARQRSLLRQQRRGRSVYCRRAQNYMEDNFDQEISILQIAEASGVSEGYLQRLYKAENGISIMEEIVRLRIEKAKALLLNTELPVVDVAIHSGFNSRQHFGIMFRRITGCTPMMWRKSRGNPDAHGTR